MNWLAIWAGIRRWWRRIANVLLALVVLYGVVLAVCRLWPTGSLTLSWGGGQSVVVPTLQPLAPPQAQPEPPPVPAADPPPKDREERREERDEERLPVVRPMSDEEVERRFADNLRRQQPQQ